MAERIAAAFAAARADRRAALMPYMMSGFPDRETSAAVAEAYAGAGADLVELGVPYSDPLADGVVIHAAGTRALAAGATLDSVLADCERIAARVPVVPMAYANMILARGPQRFAARARRGGRRRGDRPGPAARGERRDRGRAAGRGARPDPAGGADHPGGAPPADLRGRRGLRLSRLGHAHDGEREQLPATLGDLIVATQSDAEVPVAVGFGIGTPEQAAQVGAIADGVIVGTRLVRAVEEAGGPTAAAAAVTGFLTAARAALEA